MPACSKRSNIFNINESFDENFDGTTTQFADLLDGTVIDGTTMKVEE